MCKAKAKARGKATLVGVRLLLFSFYKMGCRNIKITL